MSCFTAFRKNSNISISYKHDTYSLIENYPSIFCLIERRSIQSSKHPVKEFYETKGYSFGSDILPNCRTHNYLNLKQLFAWCLYCIKSFNLQWEAPFSTMPHSRFSLHICLNSNVGYNNFPFTIIYPVWDIMVWRCPSIRLSVRLSLHLSIYLPASLL